MQTTWLISIVAWLVLTAVLIALAIYRRILTRGEYDVLHIRESEFPLVPQQAAFARRVDTVDFWGKLLTAVSAGYGFALVAILFYQVWIQTNA